MFTMTIETEFGTIFFEFETREEAIEYANKHKRVWKEDYIIVYGNGEKIKF